MQQFKANNINKTLQAKVKIKIHICGIQWWKKVFAHRVFLKTLGIREIIPQ